jgi:hypothetical protein
MFEDKLKAALREYAEAKFPGRYRSACAVIDLGPEIEPETLVILAPSAASDSRQSPRGREPFVTGRMA